MIADPDEAFDSRDPDLRAQLAEAHAQLKAKDEELERLRAQLERLEGVPPQKGAD